jgi:hypothetical protein
MGELAAPTNDINTTLLYLLLTSIAYFWNISKKGLELLGYVSVRFYYQLTF